MDSCFWFGAYMSSDDWSSSLTVKIECAAPDCIIDLSTIDVFRFVDFCKLLTLYVGSTGW